MFEYQDKSALSRREASNWSKCSMEQVREVLCLALGNDGKCFSTDLSQPFGLMEQGVPSKDRSQVALIKRLAVLGYIYRRLELVTRQSPAGPIHKALVRQIRYHLDRHCRFFTELYMENSLTLIRLNAIVENAQLKLKTLYQVHETALSFVNEIELLNQLYSAVVLSRSSMRPLVTDLFHSAFKPFVVTIRNWILHKNLINDSELFITPKQEQLDCKHAYFPYFISPNLKQLIVKFATVMKIFIKLANKQENKQTKSQIEHIFDNETSLQELTWHTKVAINRQLKQHLMEIYTKVNHFILLQLLGPEGHLVRPLQTIKYFFFSYFTIDIESTKQKYFNPTNIFQKSTYTLQDNMFKMLLSHTEKELNEWYHILIDDNSRLLYDNIHRMISNLKTNINLVLKCWKRLQNFYNFISDDWKEETKGVFRQLTITTNRILVIFTQVESQINTEFHVQWNKFLRQLERVSEVNQLVKIHHNFVNQIQAAVEKCVNEKQYKNMATQVTEFDQQINSFIDKIKQTLHSESGQWYDVIQADRVHYEHFIRQLLTFIASLHY